MNTFARALFLSIVTLALCDAGVFGQATTSTSSDQEKCGSIKATPFSRTDAPVIFGEPYIVPAIELRVTDDSTGKPQAGKQVIIHYQWLWWEYPYPERPLGVWSEASELTQCVTDEDGKIILPEHKVEPRGWYNGEMLKGRKPKFDKLSVQVFVDDHIIARNYSKSEIDKLQQEKKAVIIFPVN
jgi:hypothetical protein